MANINKQHSKLSYDELIKQNSRLKKHALKFEERFSIMIENSLAGYFFIDNDGFLRKVNDAWLKLFKYNYLKEVLGKHFAELKQIDYLEKAKLFIEGKSNQATNFAFAFEEDKQKALAAGCTDYISKPIKKDKLIELIRKYL